MNEDYNQISRYLRQFSTLVNQYRTCKSDEALVLLNRSTSLLSTAMKVEHFKPSLEVSKFFSDLHAVIGTLDINSDALWACIAVLQHCSRNLDARQALVEDFRFVPLLTFLLKRAQGHDRIERLLVLLQEFTYGIRITWEEPYIIVLLEQLVQIICNGKEESETHVKLALSVLINVCYKNSVVLFLFLRNVNISHFSCKIQKYGMLANKMLIILSEDIHTPDIKDMTTFLRSTLAAAADECVKQWNVPYLRHIVVFLTDSQSHPGLHQAMLGYKYYCDDIEKLLDHLDVRNTTDDSSDEHRKQMLCLSLLFQLIRYILELSDVRNSDGTENCISLDSNIPRVFNLVCNWIESDVCGIDAVYLLEALVRLAKTESVAGRLARDPSIVVQLVAISEKSETLPQHKSAVLTLMLTLLHQAKTEKLILSKITESYFDKMFAPLLSVKLEVSSGTSISIAEIEMFVHCLLLIIKFAGIAKKAYFEKCCTLLQMPQIQCALARAMIFGSEAVCVAIFQISQFEHFPQKQVAKLISTLNSPTESKVLEPSADQWRNFNSILKCQQTFANTESVERLNALIEVISNANENNQISNVPTSQIVELFNYKLDKLTGAEAEMRRRLDDASKDITSLTQRLNIQNAELQKYHTMNYELHINLEGLQAQCKDLNEQKVTQKQNSANLMKKLSEKSELLLVNEKRLAVKVSETIVLEKALKEHREQLQAKTQELEKLQATSKEHTYRIDKLKKTIAAFEIDVKEKALQLEEKEREWTKAQKALEELKKAKQNCDGVITVLEAQIQEKNEQIRNYELELNETEDMRKTIMSLMESKKPKRMK